MSDEPLDAAQQPIQSRYLQDRFEFAAPRTRQEPLYLMRFDDVDRGDAYFSTEEEAWEAWEQYAPGWHIQLYETMRLDRPMPFAQAHEERGKALQADEPELAGGEELLREAVSLLRKVIPDNMCCTNPNIEGDQNVPLDAPHGDLRAIALFLAKLERKPK